MPKVICFDLEGPLSPQDHAYELMKSIPDGKKIFEEISRFDDMATLRRLKNYEPGDTLKLIASFLVRRGVVQADLIKVSQKAELTPGAEELVQYLQEKGWKIFVVSTAYKEHALNIAGRLGIPRTNVFYTSFPPSRVMGGSRKVWALRRIAKKEGISLGDLAVVGDSITDFKMLRAVNEARGLAIVFNGNEYALPFGTVGVASASLIALKPILDVWVEGGLRAVRKLPHCEDLEVHKKYRLLVRKAAASLG